MKPVTVTLPEELIERVSAEARKRGISKSALVREGLESVLTDEASEGGADPWVAMAGFGDPSVAVEPGEIDDVVYGR